MRERRGSLDKKLPHWGQESSTARQWGSDLLPWGHGFKFVHQWIVLGGCSPRLRGTWNGQHLSLCSGWVQLLYLEILELSSGFHHLCKSLPFFCCWVICLQRPTQILMLPVRRGNKEEHTDLRTNSRLLIYSLESGNLLSYLFLQYEEFFPLSSSIIKSWGQNLSFSGMTLEFHTFFLKAKQALQSCWTERFPKDGSPLQHLMDMSERWVWGSYSFFVAQPL